MIYGSGQYGPCETAYRELSPAGLKSGPSWVEAYDEPPLGHCAACPDFHSAYYPLTSVQLKPRCLFPFQALHRAFLLAQQFDESRTSLSSRFDGSPFPCQQTGRKRHASSVTFSPHVELHFPPEDELGDLSVQIIHESLFRMKTYKPWRLRTRFTSKHPNQHHFPDHGVSGPPAGFTPPYQHIDVNPVGNEDNFWLHQPDHVQELAMVMNEYGETDQHGHVSFQIMTWYLRGTDFPAPAVIHD